MKRAVLVLLAIVILIPLAAIVAAQWLLSGDAIRIRLADAVRRSTGRELTIAGPLRLAWSLAPTLEARDVHLANPPGFSRPDFLHVDRVAAQVGLLPLLSGRVEFRRVTLGAPDLLLERDAQGRPNWILSPPAAPPSSTAPAAPSSARRLEVEWGAVDVRDATVAWHGASPVRLTAPHLAYARGGAVTGELVVNGVSVHLAGTAGPVLGSAWPVSLRFEAPGASLTVAGTSAEAGLGLQIPDLATLSALAGQPLPALRNVRAAATLSAAGLTGLQVDVGASALGGATLQTASLSAAALAAPADLHATVLVGHLPIAVSARAGSTAGLLGGVSTPLTLRLATDGAALEGSGSVGRGSAELAVTGRVADLAAAGVLAGIALPELRDVQLQTGLTLSPSAVSLHGLHLGSAAGDLAGDVTLTAAPRLSARGALDSQRFDLAALVPQPLPAAAPAPSPAVPTAPAAPPRPERLIPGTKLPFTALRSWDADLLLHVGEALWRGGILHGLRTHLLLTGGHLRLDPAELTAGDAPLRGQLLADATATPPTVALTAAGSGLPAGPLLGMFGGPSGATGTIDLDLALHGRGDTAQALAATLDGHAGLAWVDGEIDRAWLEAMLAGLLRAANLPLEASGAAKIRCAAIRADAASGQVTLGALTLDTRELQLDGTGTVDLRTETVDLHLRPVLRLGAALNVPVQLRGTLRAPKVALDAGAISPGRFGLTIGGPPPADTCGPALALARDGHPGAAPPAPAPMRAPKPADLLRSLFR